MHAKMPSCTVTSLNCSTTALALYHVCTCLMCRVQVRLLGSTDKPACRYLTASPPPPPPNAIVTATGSILGTQIEGQTAGRRALTQSDTDSYLAPSSQGSLSDSSYGFATLWGSLTGRQLTAVEVTDAGVDALVLQAYERLAVIALILCVAVCLHQLLAWYWHYVSTQHQGMTIV